MAYICSKSNMSLLFVSSLSILAVRESNGLFYQTIGSHKNKFWGRISVTHELLDHLLLLLEVKDCPFTALIVDTAIHIFAILQDERLCSVNHNSRTNFR